MHPKNIFHSNTPALFYAGKLVLLVGLAASLGACGGGDEASAPSSSTYLSFPGSSNGESVVDAYNNFAKFKMDSRVMEIAKAGSDIKLDSENNLIKSGNKKIGKVRLVSGSGGTAIAGLVATDGTMLVIESVSSGAVTLANSEVRFAAPGTGGGSGSGSTENGGSAGGTETGQGDLKACASVKYPGDTSEPQVAYFDQIAQFDACAYRATGDRRYITDGNLQCKSLNNFLNSISNNFKPVFCNGPLLKY